MACFALWGISLCFSTGIPVVWPLFLGPTIAFLVLIGLKLYDRLSERNLIWLMMGLGFWLRLCYVLYTTVDTRQHDVWGFSEAFTDFTYYRHGEYIQYIATHLKLPEVDPTLVGLSQVYHPPLHHLLAGLWLRLNLTLGVPFAQACENIQFLTLFYSTLCTVFGYKTLQLLKVKGKALMVGTAILSFHPTLTILAGSVNNDVLCTALSFFAVYATVRWYQNPTIKNILAIAFGLGFAMMTKLSAGLLAPAIAFVFVYRWWKSYGEGCFGKTTVQFLLFGLICVPLGLWWPVKNAVLYGIPINYVPALSADSGQYLGGYSVIQRLFGCPKESLSQIFMCWTEQNGAPYNEYGSLLALLKTSLFGEFTLFSSGTIGETACKILFYV
ncbi:MAG: glycosyltransferase family 39 protein, partial [Clostridia bacterium]|nr:glycosyltransferase family 39 protein [Clostridia bacterium]